MGRYSTFSDTCPDGDCTIAAVDDEGMPAIESCLDHFKVPYTGQNMRAAIQSALLNILDPKREHHNEKRII